jgi:hypothetical protein
MQSLVRLVPSKQDYPRLGIWTFCIAWLIGNVALIVGFNGGQGKVPAMCAFVIACLTWWAGFRLGGTKSRVGNLVGFFALSIWILNFLGAMVLYFRYYIADVFFWVSASALLVLITTFGLSKGSDTSFPAA